jgi:hypothetical protein
VGEKISLDIDKGNGILVSVGGNPKNNEEIPLLPLERFRRGKNGSHFLVMVFPCKDRIPRILFVWGNVWFT